MRMKVHELHPSIIHAPLMLIPAAALTELRAALHPSRRDSGIGRALWWGAAASGLVAGLAGMAASQEVKAGSRRSEDMMWLHGIGNVSLVATALGIAVWRSRHRPSLSAGVGGLVGSVASFYTAWLGGEMVYRHGIGVKALPASADCGAREDLPPLLSRGAPARLLRDAVTGLTWLFRRAWRAAAGREPVDRAALGFEPIERHRPQAQPAAPL